MHTLKIKIQNCPDYCLTLQEIQYVIKTLLVIAGFPHQFLRDDSLNRPDLFFGTQPHPSGSVSILMTSVSRNACDTPPSIYRKDNIVYFDFGSNSHTHTRMAPMKIHIKLGS